MWIKTIVPVFSGTICNFLPGVRYKVIQVYFIEKQYVKVKSHKGWHIWYLVGEGARQNEKKTPMGQIYIF